MAEPKYRVRWSEEDQAYVATADEFPSLSWIADSREAALDGIRSVSRIEDDQR